MLLRSGLRRLSGSRLRRPIFRLLHLWWRVRRGMTLGVRIAAFDRDGRVLLVRHTYLPGWHLPGGGVEPGETGREAASRELREEGGIEAAGPLRLHGCFRNLEASGRDHVLVYVTRGVRPPGRAPGPSLEIEEAGFFPPDGLPDGITAGTRARLREIAAGSEPAPAWT